MATVAQHLSSFKLTRPDAWIRFCRVVNLFGLWLRPLDNTLVGFRCFFCWLNCQPVESHGATSILAFGHLRPNWGKSCEGLGAFESRGVWCKVLQCHCAYLYFGDAEWKDPLYFSTPISIYVRQCFCFIQHKPSNPTFGRALCGSVSRTVAVSPCAAQLCSSSVRALLPISVAFVLGPSRPPPLEMIDSRSFRPGGNEVRQ